MICGCLIYSAESADSHWLPAGSGGMIWRLRDSARLMTIVEKSLIRISRECQYIKILHN